MKDVFFIRHGESLWQTGYTENKDSSLSRKGKAQSAFLCRHLHKTYSTELKIGNLYSSLLKRSLQTIHPLKYTVCVDKRLNEAPFSVRSSLPKNSALKEHVATEDLNSYYSAFKSTVADFWHDLLKEPSDKPNFVFTHSGVIKTVLRILHNNDTVCYGISNCSITHLRQNDERWIVNALSFDAFLPQGLRNAKT